MFSTLQTLHYSISKSIQANPCGFSSGNKKRPLNKYAQFQEIHGPDGRGNDLKIASFFSFLQTVAF